MERAWWSAASMDMGYGAKRGSLGPLRQAVRSVRAKRLLLSMQEGLELGTEVE